MKYFKIINKLVLVFLILLIQISCKEVKKDSLIAQAEITMGEREELPDNLVIAHRGTTYRAPEETEAAMRWARNTGADYLEIDLQRSKDGYLLALHDETLVRTSNIEEKYPERKTDPVSEFTYAELLSLDAGSWFNRENPERAKEEFAGLDILTLEDVIQIAEGKRIKRNAAGKRILDTVNGKLVSIYEQDPEDIGHRPGVYIETKVPALFPGIETDLRQELERLGWYKENPARLKKIQVEEGRVGVANSTTRIILQTFSVKSLQKLNETFKDYVPLCLLLWQGSTGDDLPDNQPNTFQKWVDVGKKYGADIIGPSIAGEPNNYPELLTPENAEIARKAGLKIHAYSFDTWEQMLKYTGYQDSTTPHPGPCLVDGMFTNKADEALMYYKEKFGR